MYRASHYKCTKQIETDKYATVVSESGVGWNVYHCHMHGDLIIYCTKFTSHYLSACIINKFKQRLYLFLSSTNFFTKSDPLLNKVYFKINLSLKNSLKIMYHDFSLKHQFIVYDLGINKNY